MDIRGRIGSEVEEESEEAIYSDGPPAPPALKRKKSTKEQVMKSHLELGEDSDGMENLPLSELKKILQEKRKPTPCIKTSTKSDCSRKTVATRSQPTENLSVRRSARISDAEKVKNNKIRIWLVLVV